MQIPGTIVDLSRHAIDIPEDILQDLQESGISEERVRSKVLTLANDFHTWKPVEKWALAEKDWVTRHSKHVRERCCYVSVPTNRWTLHPVLSRIFEFFSERVMVELAVDFYNDRGVVRARVKWYTERQMNSRTPKPH